MNTCKSLVPRFWDHVRIGGDGCWEWCARFDSHGYGKFGRLLAHRVAWRCVRGPLAAGVFVCHRCDNRRCVRPSHLFLGTIAENTADMVAKGRQAKGERINTAKLSAVDVAEIRRLYRMTALSQREIAERFGIGQPHVSTLVLGRSWRHLEPAHA